MIIEIELFTSLDDDLLNDKEALINVANVEVENLDDWFYV